MDEMNYFENEIEEPTVEMEPVEVETEESGIGAGMVALIATGAVAACAAAVHWGKKLWTKHKADKELRKPDENQPVEPDPEQIEEVATPEETAK